MPTRFRALALASACLLAVLTGTAAAPASARDVTCATTLWTSGTGGYDTYRIPAVVNDGGTLVAFAEGRRNSSADGGDTEVVERRSTDGGCTWTPQQVAADAWTDTIGNEVPLVTDTGTLVLVTDWQRGTVTQSQIQAGQVPAADGRRIFVQTSTDAGTTWTARREITSSVKKPTWLWYATGPGHGVTIQHGVALGRLVVSADHTELGTLRGVHTLISDDDGATWRIGASDDHTDGVITPDETTAAERLDGAMYFSSRNQSGTDPAHRAYTYSLSSGSTFSAPFRAEPDFVTPIVEGSLLQDPGYPAGVTCAPLLYTGPEDPSVRRYLTLRRSDDGGQTWRDIAELTGPTVPAAYSDMVKTSRTTLGVAYETGATSPDERIDWTTLTLGCP